MAKCLWEPSIERINKSNMHRFKGFVNRRHNKNLNEYSDLYKWSIDNISAFWAAFWEFVGIKASKPYTQVVDDLTKMPGADWFKGAYLNFAENLLRFRDDQTAIIFQAENKVNRCLTYSQLYDQVAAMALALKQAGVKPGDRVAAFMPNMPETVIAMLAATSLGAIWSSCSPDFGIKGVLDRFGQIQPKILFSADGYFFKGVPQESQKRIASILDHLPSVQKLVVVPFISPRPKIDNLARAILYDDFCQTISNGKIEFEQLPFNHPLYIMYSSGTTGLPKCMVQSAGGILIHHLKELILHTDLKRNDTIFYFTTCGWMMWNWLISSLAVGAAIVLYDGNPFHPSPLSLWEMAQDERITIFGTSAGYLSALENTGVRPKQEVNLKNLRTVLSTGSPLSVEGFEYVYRHIKKDVQLASISGGTDLNGCFALGNPMGPVYAGELQCRGLAMKVKAFDHQGCSVVEQKGELVCTAPFPSMPIYFWDDPDGQKYHNAYFNLYPGVWRHGDFIMITERGGVIMLGRSDATLNPGGVRIGTAEIYRQVDLIEEIEDCVVVEQVWKKDVRVILFVKMAHGVALDDPLKTKIRQTIRANASPRHVPAKIIAVPDIPYTLNMKKVELAVKKVINNEEIHNKDALRNPEVLNFYSNIHELQID
jgi:acetoacetyl-CoA synthetase